MLFDLLLTDVVEAVANEAVYPEHNISLHPYFNFDVSRNVTARVGQTTFLQCRVEQLGDKSVSFTLTFICVEKVCFLSMKETNLQNEKHPFFSIVAEAGDNFHSCYSNDAMSLFMCE